MFLENPLFALMRVQVGLKSVDESQALLGFDTLRQHELPTAGDADRC
jgi:hypothetical protein